MSATRVTRRTFARAVGAALGACALAPRLAPLAGAAPAPPSAPSTRLTPAAPAGAVRIDSNENPYGPFPKALKAMTPSDGACSRYPDNLEDEVTAALAKLHGVSTENVILGCGSGEVLRMAGMAFLKEGKRVVAAEPTFEAVLAYARVTHAEAVKVPLTSDHRHDLPRMVEACSESTGLVYVCNPNNPTGTIVTKQELGTFLDRVPTGAMVLVDEAYHHFVEDSKYASAFEWMGKKPNLLVARTFSKIYGLAGMRLGYGVGSKEAIEAMRPYRTWSNTNAAVLQAALASLGDAAQLESTRHKMNATRSWLRAEMAKDSRTTIDSHANFVMIDVGSDVAPIIATLRERNVFVGRKFPSMGNWLRVSVGTQEEMQKFVAALRAVLPAATKAA
jgi:histidinol-phosphate aminotransferase